MSSSCGSGFAGLGMAIQLEQAGRDDFIILEKADDLGGTWRDNTYPGLRVRRAVVPVLVLVRAEPELDRGSYSPQPEIWAYLAHCADEYGLRPQIRFGTEVDAARRTTRRPARGDVDDQRRRSRSSRASLVSGVGALHVPKVPDIPGLETLRAARPSTRRAGTTTST